MGTFLLMLLVMMGAAALLEVLRHYTGRNRREYDALLGETPSQPAWYGMAQAAIVLGGVLLAGYLLYDFHERTMARIPAELEGACPPPQPRFDPCRNR